MAETLFSRARRGWNAFLNKKDEDDSQTYRIYGSASSGSIRPDRPRFTRGNERSIVTAVYNRIALDVAAIGIMHVKLDENGRFSSVVNSSLNNCLTLEANIDQTSRAFIQDVVISLLDEGCVAILPVDTNVNPNDTSSYQIETMRVGKITEWFPREVRVKAYNDRTGHQEEIRCAKENVAIIENPLYAVMNEPNSTMQRLIRKLNLLDYVDEQVGSDKMNLIIQLPYAVKSQMQKDRADERIRAVEAQLQNNKYGIAYIDATEKVTQLNRSIDNDLLKQVEYLTNLLYSQLGITQSVMDGTADEKTMLNYMNRSVEPIISAIVDEMKRKFLTKTARTQGQSIAFFRDPFKLVPVDNIAEIADKFTRNEIMTPNEIRQVIGMMPASDPEADQLRNRNISESNKEVQEDINVDEEEVNSQNGEV